jgi:hypothetical protein
MLGGLMREMYEAANPPDDRVAKAASRSLRVGAPVEFEIFLSGMKRQKYEAQNRAYVESGDTACRLCWGQWSLIFQDRLAVAPDSFPFFPYHMLLRPVLPERIAADRFETLAPDIKRGFVTKADLDCRDAFTDADIATLCALVEAAPEFMVTQSMRGSGASIPEHIHAHAFLRSQTRFPLLQRRCFHACVGSPHAWVNTHVSYVLVLCGAGASLARIIASLHGRFRIASNHYIQIDADFGGLAVGYVPRTATVPAVPRLATAEWKFGAFEVLGLYDAKTSELYETLSADEACSATRSVTVQDSVLRQEIERAAVGF